MIDSNAEDVRFLQASRHGEVLTPVELVEDSAGELNDKDGCRHRALTARRVSGHRLGPRKRSGDDAQTDCLGHFVSEELADALDRHYVLDAAGDHHGALQAEKIVDQTIASFAQRRQWAQKIGALALLPFIGLLIAHGVNHEVPLFLASFAGFLVALLGIFEHSQNARPRFT